MKNKVMLSDQLKDTKLPDWIKTHEFFKTHSKLNKVFPSIGLKNGSEKIVVNITNSQLLNLRAKAENIFSDIRYHLLLSNDKYIKNDICNIFTTKNITTSDKVELKLVEDFIKDDKIIFKKNTSLFKIYNKVREENPGLNLPKLEDFYSFKDFSQSNVPQKGYTVGFTSTGLDGIWNFATVSMRGIESCQSWKNPQSRAIIGAIINKYIGVAYVEGDQKTEYGNKFLLRSMIGYGIREGKPGLIMYNTYGGSGSLNSLIVDFINKRSKVPLVERGSFSLLKDNYGAKFLAVGEDLYLDYAIPFMDTSKQKSKKIITSYSSDTIFSSLFNNIKNDKKHERSFQTLFQKIRDNHYSNALQNKKQFLRKVYTSLNKNYKNHIDMNNIIKKQILSELSEN